MNIGWDAEIERRALAEVDGPTGLDVDICPSCDGSGSVTEESMEPDEGFRVWAVTCPTCKGDGRVDTSPCIACGAPVYAHEADCPIGQGEVR
jgi:DnaJ-class molecular chaperone